jgi:predicted  nucleic acid-binding Zn-ribbon protein
MSTDPILVELAREDALLFQMRQQVAALPKRISGLDEDKNRLERQLADVEAVFQRTEKERRKLEIELEEFKQKRAKSESRESALTSLGQLEALQREMRQQDARIEELETSVLEAMERSEQATKRRDVETRRLHDEVQRLGALQEQLRRDLQSARASIEEQSKKRDAAVHRVDPRIRSLYERVLRAKGDAAIALVQERTCGICNALQPPQVIQILRGPSPTLQQCQVCGRILVFDPAAA